MDIDKLNCTSLEISVSGAGDIDISGKATKARINVSGAGDIDIEDLEVEDLDTSVSGVGKIKRSRKD